LGSVIPLKHRGTALGTLFILGAGIGHHPVVAGLTQAMGMLADHHIRDSIVADGARVGHYEGLCFFAFVFFLSSMSGVVVIAYARKLAGIRANRTMPASCF